MVLAIYKKNKIKDKWLLASLAPDIITAKKYSRLLKKNAKKIGFDDAQSVVQTFNSINDVPGILDDIQPEKALWN